jgi:hypothetical protein
MADDDLIRRGDAALAVLQNFTQTVQLDAIAALPEAPQVRHSQGVRVKPLVWEETRRAGFRRASCPVFGTMHYAEGPEDEAEQDATRAHRIIAALEPAEAGGVEATLCCSLGYDCPDGPSGICCGKPKEFTPEPVDFEAVVAGLVSMRTPAPVDALVQALRLALDYVEGCKVNGLPDLGAASSLPFMDDVLRIGDASLAAIREGRNG